MFFLLIHLVLVLVALIGLNELCRRLKILTVVVFFILPILLIPVWLNSGIDSWFRWVKLFSVVFAVVWFTFFRFTKLGEKDFVKFIAAAILCINILEAVVQDLLKMQIPNTLNAAAGILSIVTLSGWRGITTDQSCKEKDMVWPEMTMFWIVGYTVWNWVFVYFNFPENAAFHIMVLLACFIPALFKKSLWMQARAFTLAGWMIYFFTFPNFISSQVVWLPKNETLIWIAAIISLSINLIYSVLHFKKKFSRSITQPLDLTLQ